MALPKTVITAVDVRLTFRGLPLILTLVAPRMDFEKKTEQARNAQGVPLWEAHVALPFEGYQGAPNYVVCPIVIAAPDAPAIAPSTPVDLVALKQRTNTTNGRVSFSAETVRPLKAA